MVGTSHLPILVVLLPLVTAYITPLLGWIDKRICNPLVVVSMTLAFLASLLLARSVLTGGVISYHMGGFAPPFGIELVVDYFGVYMCIIISFITLMAAIYSREYVAKELHESKTVPYYTLLMLMTGGMMGASVTGDLFNLFVFFEILSISSYALVAITGKKVAIMASYKYLLLGAIATSFTLVGIAYLYILTGTLNMADLSVRLQSVYGVGGSSWTLIAALAFFMVGYCIKAALFPLHTWLPDAHSMAPSSISAVLSGILIKVGALAIIRVLFNIFQPEFVVETIPITSMISWMAAAAIIAGSLFAISQTDIKRMLAYSSVAHIGFIILGIGLATGYGTTGGILHIFNHAMAKGCLFLCAGAIIYKTGIRNIDDLAGLGNKMPFTMAAFTIASLSMIGIPPTAGFVSKFYLGLGALETGTWSGWVFIGTILVGSLLTAVFYMKVINNIYFKEPLLREDVQRDETPLGMLIPILILAGGCVIFGLFPRIPLSLAEPAAKLFLGGI
ncbi:MAG: monovalent cation/H+ antiporter subunit D family protein [Methanocellales archaeon]|nr:monovalent cation/H+ antiporter subunit D family protein [Methanocellales archaeon]MDD3421276.1 monovalent cation/H+ antiporter subunit D family protein [Methanocellales archaeon]MDD4898162.1 monovalent cation/H+ antiporter subunit D family protein [Methanocellales archaeon]MDD5446752.1 monovalent cation/H+ antiporter subunit D family protein [Methanocellales archaeon]